MLWGYYGGSWERVWGGYEASGVLVMVLCIDVCGCYTDVLILWNASHVYLGFVHFSVCILCFKNLTGKIFLKANSGWDKKWNKFTLKSNS